MRKFFAMMVLGWCAAAHSQVIGLNPTPIASYYWNTSTNAWTACTNSSTAEPYASTPQAFALHGYNSSLGQWTPLTACPSTSGGGGGGGLTSFQGRTAAAAVLLLSDVQNVTKTGTNCNVSGGYAYSPYSNTCILVGTNFVAGGDLSGSATSQTVVGIRGYAVANIAPTNGQSLFWNSSLNEYVPGFILTGYVQTSPSASQTVAQPSGTTLNITGDSNVLQVNGTPVALSTAGITIGSTFVGLGGTITDLPGITSITVNALSNPVTSIFGSGSSYGGGLGVQSTIAGYGSGPFYLEAFSTAGSCPTPFCGDWSLGSTNSETYGPLVGTATTWYTPFLSGCLSANSTSHMVTGTGSACGSGVGGVPSVNGITSAVTIAGTASQIGVTTSGSTITLSNLAPFNLTALETTLHATPYSLTGGNGVLHDSGSGTFVPDAGFTYSSSSNYNMGYLQFLGSGSTISASNGQALWTLGVGDGGGGELSLYDGEGDPANIQLNGGSGNGVFNGNISAENGYFSAAVTATSLTDSSLGSSVYPPCTTTGGMFTQTSGCQGLIKTFTTTGSGAATYTASTNTLNIPTPNTGTGTSGNYVLWTGTTSQGSGALSEGSTLVTSTKGFSAPASQFGSTIYGSGIAGLQYITPSTGPAPTLLSSCTGYANGTIEFGTDGNVYAQCETVGGSAIWINPNLGAPVTLSNFSINTSCAPTATISDVHGTDANHYLRIDIGSTNTGANCVLYTFTYTIPRNHASCPMSQISSANATGGYFPTGLGTACVYGDDSATSYSYRVGYSLSSSSLGQLWIQILAP